ncbi:MAG: hypothetical protein DMG67_04875 [Acidobacteria bacterium]|nr:MAG: hypothetical protein DMG67_04875 [Acidobacteriota bacterium]
MMHITRLFLMAMTCLALGTNGCRKSSMVSDSDKPSHIKVEPRSQGDEPPTVVFEMRPSNNLDMSAPFQLYDCTYQARGKTAKFRLELKQKLLGLGGIPSASVEGKFIAVTGSDNSALLEDLKKALDAKQIPTNPARVTELPFDAILLDEKLSRSPARTFSDNPPGDWMMVKVFLPKGSDDEGELFLNLNPLLSKGEFSIKDSDYGDYLLKQFAKVL